jgi:hypothetical protein
MGYCTADHVLGVLGGGDIHRKGGFKEVSESRRQPAAEKPLPASLGRLLSMFDCAINPGLPISSSHQNTTQFKEGEDDSSCRRKGGRKGGFGWKP